MKRIGFIMLTLVTSRLLAIDLASPNGRLGLDFYLNTAGEPCYRLALDGAPVIKESRMGIAIKENPGLFDRFTVLHFERSQTDTSWEPVWGEAKRIRNHYNELEVTLQRQEPEKRIMILRFRLFDEGLGFRYEFPRQPNLGYFTVSDEKTEFNLTGDHRAWWIPGDYDTNEYDYATTPLSKVDAMRGRNMSEIAVRSIIAANAVQTPLMLKTAEGLYINLFEAALVNYPAMNLLIDQKSFSLTARLVPDAVGNMAYLQTPEKTPWRTVIVSRDARDILASRMILNLNEPCALTETGWIKPQKYIGIWWGMHVGTASWNMADTSNLKLAATDWKALKPNGHHGATTAETKRYLDFAARHGFDGVLVEGWNVGWEDWFGNWKEEVFDFVTPYPDFDVDELQHYAADRGVRLIMHHETSAAVTNYERRMPEAYAFMNAHGYTTVKTGYVGRIIPRGEHHDGQWMVNHYLRVARETARHRIMIDVHEPVRPTGLQRTWPNWLACEAARGNEYNAWSSGNPPEHETILPFTRLMGGPMDYTPGIFQIKMEYYKPGSTYQVHTTLVKQLALYVTLYSPLQMAADLIENYDHFPDAFQFIKDVAVDWDESRILAAEPGDYVTIARKAKNSDKWFIGAITDEQARQAEVKLDFLDQGEKYTATLYLDAADAHWQKNPMAYRIHKGLVTSKSVLRMALAPGGGAAVSLWPASPAELQQLKPLK
ncbi:MAG TPA: glycoside hydrolase family 97 protein [bacterium]|nr:glycoside hydrolase family 97 protein [bacterium]